MVCPQCFFQDQTVDLLIPQRALRGFYEMRARCFPFCYSGIWHQVRACFLLLFWCCVIFRVWGCSCI